MKLIIDIDTDIAQGIRGENDCKVEPREIVRSFQATIAGAIANGTPYNPTGDCISREWLEKQIYVSTNCYLQAHKDAHFDVYKRGWNDAIDYIIDNAPTVEPFTQLEKEEIADAITYLLDAELLEENGYTEEVINALKSALKKVGGAE